MPTTYSRISLSKSSFVKQLVLPVLLLSVAGNGWSTESGNSRSVCTHPEASEPRVVEVIYEDSDSPLPCKVLYEKDGGVKEVAAAKNSRGHCEKTERKIVLNLVKGGYDCQHAFSGLGGADLDRSMVLNLFRPDVEGSISTTDTTDTTDATDATVEIDQALAVDSATEAPTTGSTQALSSELPIVESLPVEFEEGGTHIHEFTHSHPLTEGGEARSHIHRVLEHIPQTELAGITDSSQATPEDSSMLAADVLEDAPAGFASPDSDKRYFADQDIDFNTISWALLTRAMFDEKQAHRFAGELRRRMPGVENRVVSVQDEGQEQWHVALGVGNDEAALSASMEPLDESVRSLFSIQAVPQSANAAIDTVPDDWARYALASCWADGHRSSEELAQCSSLVVDEDSFINCFGGGFCAPSRYVSDEVMNALDFLEVMDSEDPVATARDRIAQRVEGCEQMSDVTDAEFAECSVLSALDDDQRDMYDCYQRSDSELALLECSGDDEIADYARAWDRCSVSGYKASSCLLEESDSPFLQSASYCLAYEHAADIVRCSADANLSEDQGLLLSCVTDYEGSTEKAACLARERLSDSEYAAISCANLADSARDYGSCVATQSNILSDEALYAARCFGNAEQLSASSLLECGGGQYLESDIVNCLEYGLGTTQCFDSQTLMADLAYNELQPLAELAFLDNEITRFRHELYASQGGDLDRLLTGGAEESLAAIQAAAAATAAAVSKAGKKTKGKLFGIFKRGNK